MPDNKEELRNKFLKTGRQLVELHKKGYSYSGTINNKIKKSDTKNHVENKHNNGFSVITNIFKSIFSSIRFLLESIFLVTKWGTITYFIYLFFQFFYN